MSNNELTNAIVNMAEDESARLTVQQLESGVDPLDILDDCREAMTIIGGRF